MLHWHLWGQMHHEVRPHHAPRSPSLILSQAVLKATSTHPHAPPTASTAATAAFSFPCKNISTSKFQNKMSHVPEILRAPVARYEYTKKPCCSMQGYTIFCLIFPVPQGSPRQFRVDFGLGYGMGDSQETSLLLQGQHKYGSQQTLARLLPKCIERQWLSPFCEAWPCQEALLPPHCRETGGVQITWS